MWSRWPKGGTTSSAELWADSLAPRLNQLDALWVLTLVLGGLGGFKSVSSRIGALRSMDLDDVGPGCAFPPQFHGFSSIILLHTNIHQDLWKLLIINSYQYVDC